MNTTREPTPNERSPIRRRSSPSVQIFSLDLNEVRTRLKKAVQRLAENYPEIEEVWLFGSLARGDATPGSDADLMVLVSRSPLPFLERPLRYQLDFCGLGTDILVYTRAEAAQMESEGHPLFRAVYTEGVPLFRRAGVTHMTEE